MTEDGGTPKIDPIQVGPEAYAVIDIECCAHARAPALVHPTHHPEYGFESNRLGVVGELAVQACLKGLVPSGWAVYWVADRHKSRADIEITPPHGMTTVEVKTINPEQWQLHGRIIGVDQLYETDARIYVWCVAPRLSRPIVHVLGWSTAEEMRRMWSPALFTGQPRPRPPVQPEKLVPSPLSQLANPIYGLDDSGVDEYESYAFQWDESRADSELDETHWERFWEQDWEYREWERNRKTAALRIDDWTEGDLPQHGFGSGKETAKIYAAVRPITELIPWIIREDTAT